MSDPRYEDAYRRALDAADTDVILDLGPAGAARRSSDDGIAAVTGDGRVLVWDVTSHDPVRVDEEPSSTSRSARSGGHCRHDRGG